MIHELSNSEGITLKDLREFINYELSEINENTIMHLNIAGDDSPRQETICKQILIDNDGIDCYNF